MMVSQMTPFERACIDVMLASATVLVLGIACLVCAWIVRAILKKEV